MAQRVACKVLSTKAGIQRHHEAHTRDAINPQGSAWQVEVVQPDGIKEIR